MTPTTAAHAPRTEAFVATLRERFLSGSLEVVVGAGASIASGLPSWNELNRRLLAAYLAQVRMDLDLRERDLDAAARVFVDSFGREAVVDVVRSHLTEAQYVELLRTALYRDGAKDVSSIHLELAALLGAMQRSAQGSPRRLHGLYTFNFDDLLERAAERLLGRTVEPVVEGERPAEPHVVHLHGFVAPDAGSQRPRGTLVLSEKDYHEALGDWASRKLEDLFQDGRKTVLMVGLSLADPRLRWLLLERLKRAQQGKPVAEVFALVSESAPPEEAELIERLARHFVREHQAEFWASWRMQVLGVDSHDLVPHVLRQVRLGPDGQDWARRGEAFLRASSRVYPRLYEEDVQRRLQEVLRDMLQLLRRRFAVPADEELHLGGFVPSGDAQLRMGFGYRGGSGEDDLVDDARARARTLSVASLERAQGASGRAFLLGAVVEATRRSSQLDRNFTPAMRLEWTRERTYASLLCVPVYDSTDWVPVGVAYLTSNRRQGFWTQLESQDYDDLRTLLRNTFMEVLEYPPV